MCWKSSLAEQRALAGTWETLQPLEEAADNSGGLQGSNEITQGAN